ncbi:MAG: preprotein translocase subunit SecE [Spirochaetia bacterium]
MSISMIVLSIIGIIFLMTLLYYRKNIWAFVGTARQEMRRVVWPTPERAFRQMKVIIISLIIFACFFGLVDYVMYRLVNFVF